MTPCREWSGYRNAKGYGFAFRSGNLVRVHRWVWELYHGPISDGMCILHHCDNPPCFRLDHLFIGTIADNNLDMAAKGRNHQQRKSHCPQGHPYDEENTRVVHGRRRCRTCKRMKDRARQRTKRETAALAAHDREVETRP